MIEGFFFTSQRGNNFASCDNINKFVGRCKLPTLNQEENHEPNKKDIYKKPTTNVTLSNKTPKSFPFFSAVIPSL